MLLHLALDCRYRCGLVGSRRNMHWLFIYLVWMLYILLVMGVLEAASDRTDDLRGAGTALVSGAVLGLILTVLILWLGPLDPFAP